MDLREVRRKVVVEIGLFERAIPTATTDIDYVWVLSGSGDYHKPFLPNEPIYHPWSDQRRISRGVLLALQVVSLRLGKSVDLITKDDLQDQGPYLIYNGSIDRNSTLRRVVELPDFLMPKEKVVIVDGVWDNGGTREITNTLDQVLSFPTDQLGNQLKGAVAIVSSAPHFPRILRYLSKHRPFPDGTLVRCFPIPSDFEWAEKFAEEETKRVCDYLEKGYLTEEPYPKDLGIS